MTERFDALVIGGGPAGATAALLLAKRGWSVVLVEKKAFPRRKVCGEYLSGTNLPLLEELQVARAFCASAGPEVRRVGLFAGRSVVSAELPRPAGGSTTWGRALAREHLDTLLLEQARLEGVQVLQPCSAVDFDGNLHVCKARTNEASVDLAARVVIAAHGSWDAGTLPTQPPRRKDRADLLAFKAHFENTSLPAGLMPLLAFPGGYGGMVHTDSGRLTLSCCIRQDRLESLRADTTGQAGERVLNHILDACLGARRALCGARRVGSWLAAGPIRPGIRLTGRERVFLVGNAAGEAHPVIAEGISMALQSARLLANHLHAWRESGGRRGDLQAVNAAYATGWRKAFAPRLYAAAGIAHWAMNPAFVAGSLPWLHCFPQFLSWGARLSGKATPISQGSVLTARRFDSHCHQAYERVG